MKRLSSIFVALALLATSTVFAANNPTADRNDTNSEITKLLKNPDFIVDHEMQANVLFTVNDDNEIVVLSVETQDSEIENYVKQRLNLRKLDSKIEHGKQYIVPVRIKSEK